MRNYCRVDYRRYKKGKQESGKTPTYECWLSMRRRCLYPKTRQFHLYGGRGVSICQRWLDSYDAFFEDMGPKPTGKSLDKDILGTGLLYSPECCMWATPKEQSNARRSTHFLTFDGVTKPLQAWASERGIIPSTLYGRIFERGYSVEEALAVPFIARAKPTPPIKQGLGITKSRNGRYASQFQRNGIRHHLGTFNCPLMARIAYEDAYTKELGHPPPKPRTVPQFN